MYLELKSIHSFIALILLAVLFFAVVFNANSWLRKKPFTKTNKIVSLIGMASAHTQLLIGMLLYFLSPLGMSNFSGAAMKDSSSRLYILEHPLMMIIGVVLISIGYIKAKGISDDQRKYKTIVIYYTLGLLFILSKIPWSTWS